MYMNGRGPMMGGHRGPMMGTPMHHHSSDADASSSDGILPAGWPVYSACPDVWWLDCGRCAGQYSSGEYIK